MRKTIGIDNLRDVHVGDMLFVKGRSDGFRVAGVFTDSLPFPFAVDIPFGYGFAYVNIDEFDHAERTVEEPEWPQPSDLELHVYLGADGNRYLYMPAYEGDTSPWRLLTYPGNAGWAGAEDMTKCHPAALPLRELKLVPKEEES